MQLELSHREASRMFPALIDEDLGETDALKLRSHLDGCESCRTGWQRYERTVKQVRDVPRERAPANLATAILLRSRRRRSGLRALARVQVEYRVPFEVIIPILLGALVAALLVFSAS